MTDETNTIERPSEFDALVKLRPDEPHFLLLGRDRTAPDLVQQWADGNRRKALREHHRGEISEGKLETELRQATDAEKIGWAMRSYKAADEPVKDSESAPLLAYTGYEQPEDGRLRDAEQRGRARALSAMRNAIAELNDAIPALKAVGKIEDAECAETIFTAMIAACETLTPKRP